MRAPIGTTLVLVGLLLTITACAKATPTPTPMETPTPPPTPTATPTPEPEPSVLLRVLDRIPASFKDEGVGFANVRRVLELAEAPHVSSSAELVGLNESERKAWNEAVQGMARPGGAFTSAVGTDWEQTFGFDFFDTSLAVGIGKGLLFALPFDPSYLEGGFDEETIRYKLQGLGYNVREAAGHTYYAIREDYVPDTSGPTSVSMNRVYVEDGTLMAAPATHQAEAFLETWAGARSSLAEDTAFSSLARALGDALSAVLLMKDTVWEPVKDGLARYEKPEEWGELHQWGAFSAGYGKTSEGEGWIRFLLFYDDPGAAEADAQELVQRMRNYETASDLMGSGAIWGWPERLFEEICSSLTPQVQREKGGSTLTVRCDLNEGMERSWLVMLEMRDLGFLVP